jgi:diaminohydroxyphosphoribosylaminopyrimidine deaminase/5-amino-6-(5-phosphoribosylamino)uracil reductase
MVIDDNFYMNLAIEQAWKYQLLTYPNPAVGSVVVKQNQLISIESHKKSGEAHAEVNALKSAYLFLNPNSILKDLTSSNQIHDFLLQHHNGFFNDCTIYVTLEPCNHIGKTPSCAMLLKELKPKRVVIGTLDPNKEASGGYERLIEANIKVDINILKTKCDDLLYPFLLWQKKQFKFFKMATRLDGSIGGGKISSEKSLIWNHTLRTKIDVMLIGGNTVRIDRPTLDSRYVSKKASDIIIYSKTNKFDKTIPLFSVPQREVIISDSLDILKQYNFIMIEGGYTLLNELKNDIDMLVLIVSNSMKKVNCISSDIDIKYQLLHQYQNDTDTIKFLKVIK